MDRWQINLYRLWAEQHTSTPDENITSERREALFSFQVLNLNDSIILLELNRKQLKNNIKDESGFCTYEKLDLSLFSYLRKYINSRLQELAQVVKLKFEVSSPLF